MQIESQSDYQAFLRRWESERSSMTLAEIDSLVKELAQYYYSDQIQYSQKLELIQMAAKVLQPNSLESFHL